MLSQLVAWLAVCPAVGFIYFNDARNPNRLATVAGVGNDVSAGAATIRTNLVGCGSPPIRGVILGGGSFGIAMAHVLGRNGVAVTLLMRSKVDAEALMADRRHPRYLSDIEVPMTLCATTDAHEALRDVSFLVHCVPVQHSRRYLRKISKLVPSGVPVLCTSKGIDRKTLNLMCEILPSQLGNGRSYAFLSGPSFAREIAEGLATAVVVASEDRRIAFDFRDLLASESFRVFTSADVVGLEVGGAVKNVLALAAGMCEGLDLGTNAVTALVTRGLYEMQRIALAMGGRASTIAGLSGVGDTFGTCFGPLSRNRNTGVRLGRGERLDDILADMGEVAEGVETAFALERLIKKSHKSYRLDLKFPIIFGVAEILRGDRTPREGLEALMGLPLRPEFIAPGSDGSLNRRRPAMMSDCIGGESDDDHDIDSTTRL